MIRRKNDVEYIQSRVASTERQSDNFAFRTDSPVDGSHQDTQDYDCFYAAVVEAQDPSLKGLPLAVQQKQIIVTCNYVARARGLYKLQLVREAKKMCPEVIIVLGEDLTRFRNASKDLYLFLREYSWNERVERLGFDEIWMDVTDIIDYNQHLLNQNDLENSYFCLFKNDPAAGFPFDATKLAGRAYGADLRTHEQIVGHEDHNLMQRLLIGSHLAEHLRLRLEEEKGYTSTVGISTSKLLSKLVGNVHKPHNQTTLLPPYEARQGLPNHVKAFIDSHEVGKIPNIGFKTAQKLREYILNRPAEVQEGLITFNTRDAITVETILASPNMSLQLVDKLVSGPGSVHGLGAVIWGLLHGVDDSEVKIAKEVPTQISIEDSYIRLDTLPEVRKQLLILTGNLLRRMHIDLLEDDDTKDHKPQPEANSNMLQGKRWLASPRSLRLSTRPRTPINSDGSRSRSFYRISRQTPVPSWFLSLSEPVGELIERLVDEVLIPLFKKIHPETDGWNLSLVNVAVTNMSGMAGESKLASGRNIGDMFKRQDETLAGWKVEDIDVPPDFVAMDQTTITETLVHPAGETESTRSTLSPTKPTCATDDAGGSEDWLHASQWSTQASNQPSGDWDEAMETDEEAEQTLCPICDNRMPSFALLAHLRFHDEMG